jgi:hypothetical protein
MDEAAKIEAVKSVFTNLETAAAAEAAKADYQQRAFQHLAAIQVPDSAKATTIAFANWLFARDV